MFATRAFILIGWHGVILENWRATGESGDEMVFAITHIVTATLTVSALLSMTFLLPEKNGFLDLASRARRTLPLFSFLWLITSCGQSLTTLADLFEVNIPSILDVTTIRSFFIQTSLGRVQLIEIAASLLILFFSSSVKKNGGALALLVIGAIGITAPVLESHSSSLGNHALAIGSLKIGRAHV